MSFIQIYDTTLRDGTQSEGFTLSGHDKIRVARRLDDLGVAFIEGGWPGSNPRDAEFFERARDIESVSYTHLDVYKRQGYYFGADRQNRRGRRHRVCF